MKRSIVIFLFFITTNCFAQFSIQGRVFDGQTNTPLPGANVFIANTTRGVSSDVDGAFKITGLESIHYDLVISFLGYKTEVIDVVPGQPITYKIMLGPSAQTLREITIRARRGPQTQWSKNYKIFTQHFIGLADNAHLCKIKNPSALDFDNVDNVLNAYADSMLVIENKGLGYNVKVFIDKYEYNTITTRLFYEGPVAFEALTPKDEKQKKYWARNRLKAYYGSSMHFLRALYNHNAADEGFNFRLLGNEPKPKAITDYSLVLDSTTLRFQGTMQVQFMYEGESPTYSSALFQPANRRSQTSQIHLLKPGLISPVGTIYPVDAVEMRGYWNWELVSESLPLDYNPDDDLKIVGEK